MRSRLLLSAAFLTCFPDIATSQQDSSAATIAPVVVTVTRGSGRSVLGSPYAITIASPDSARPGLRNSAVDEAVAFIPGVTSVNRNNPSQDPRISIRGFGSRSAFGVRGIRVLRDGMPVTLPDGQTPLDFISLESVGTVEVLRGAASALYGNAGGGVIDLRSEVPSPKPLSIEARQWAGTASTYRSVLTASGTSGTTSYAGDVTHARSDGMRAHSAQRGTLGFGTLAARFGGTRVSLIAMGLHNPLAENPGALTLEEMKQNPEMADASSVRRNARKTVNQAQIGMSASRLLSRSEINVSAYGGARSLDNPLTFAVVEVGRHSWGASGSYRSSGFVTGFDLQLQNDLRKNYAVCTDTLPIIVPTATCPNSGSDRGVITLHQREIVSSAGLYASGDMRLWRTTSLVAGIRADRIRFEVEDNLISNENPDDSGVRTMNALSPSLGLIARVSRAQSVYANVSTAFETPTATELGNNEDGTAGLNSELDPQRSLTFEAGAKGWILQSLRYDVAVFDTRVRDELIPFEIPASNGRRFFRNAGRTRRRGAELGVEFQESNAAVLVNYSYSRFRFSEYRTATDDFAGSLIPGVPKHRLQTALRLQKHETFAIIENELAAKAFADDANTFTAPGYSVMNFRAGSALAVRRYRVGVVAVAQNVFDRVYASSLAVNAARAKYFEPAPRRSFSFGLMVGSR